MTSSAPVRSIPRWLHAWAVLTAVAAAAAVVMGAVVTTFRVGMADPVWPTAPWHLMLISWDEPSTGYLIEHGHRLAAYSAGFCVIVLMIGLWLAGSRRLGLLALACVVVQGILGGARVLLNARAGEQLAAVHGTFAQVVFSLIVVLAVLTAVGPSVRLPSADYARRCRRTAVVLVGLIFLQLVWGALVRHSYGAAAQRLHVLTAFAVTAAIVWLLKTAWEQPAGRRLLGRPMVLLTGLLVVQISLGVEAWMGLFTGDLPPDLQPIRIGLAVVRTAHVFVGACILATAAVCATQAYRAAVAAPAEIVSHAASPTVAATSPGVKGTV